MAVTISGTDGITSPDFEPSGATVPTNGLFLPTTNTLGWSTNSTERLRVDASGNMGLGVTPSAWNSVYRAFDFGSLGGIASAANTLGIYTNVYIDSAFNSKYKTSNYATQYLQNSNGTGQHQWFIAPSGTAGNTISFTQAMTLDSSGRLLVGLTSGTYKLEVSEDASIYGVRVGRGAGGISSNTALGSGALQSNTTGNSNTASGLQALPSNTTGVQNTASGVNALYYNTTGSYNTACGVNALQGNTTGNSNTACGVSALYYTTGSGNIGIGGVTSGGSYAPAYNIVTENNRISMGSTSVTNAYIQVAWTAVSDARDKTNFAPVQHGLDFVCKLNPISYQFKVSRDVDEPHGPIRYGFKAQEILALEGDSPIIIDNEDPEKLRYNGESLVPILVKAIQELTARLEILEAK